MVALHPVPDHIHVCPHDDTFLRARDWYMPGMRTLADLECPTCGREYFGDLPSGHGIRHPKLLDKASGAVFEPVGERRFREFKHWLTESYASRRSEALPFEIENFAPIQRPVLLNCLDALYGHCVLKLLNAQYYIDHHPEIDLIVLVPRFLRWMVPDGVAAIWTVDLPLQEGAMWNDWMANEIKHRVDQFPTCKLSVAFSHPHPDDYNIERFTYVKPFLDRAEDERSSQPVLTFIWREDRVWHGPHLFGLRRELEDRLRKWFGRKRSPVLAQRDAFVAVAERVRAALPSVAISVAGVGQRARFPDWIEDLRVADVHELDEEKERSWCEQYARSHVVVGVHGSSMLLPSAHAGAVVDLVPRQHWRNVGQDTLACEQDARMAVFRYRNIPLSTQVAAVADIVVSLYCDMGLTRLHFERVHCDHERVAAPGWRPKRADEVERC